MIKLLLKHKADISKASLSDAIRNQDRDMVLAIIGAGADINSKNENALSLCAMKDMDKMARFLLDNGADIHAKDYSDKTALENALENDAINTARLLLEKGASKTEDGANRALRLVALRGLDQLLRPLLGRGAKVNAIGDEEDDYGHKGAYDRRFTPLVLAIKGKQARMIEELLKQGAELNLADNYIGWKPVIHAAYDGNEDVVKILMDHGADPTEVNDYGYSALFTAVRFGHVEATRLMLDQGADVNSANINGWTLLIMATKADRAEMAQFLIARGADVNAHTIHGRGAVDFAHGKRVREIIVGAVAVAGKPGAPALAR